MLAVFFITPSVPWCISFIYGSLVFPQSGILKRVFEEADKVVQELKEALYAHMADPKVELAQVYVPPFRSVTVACSMLLI